MASPQDIKQSEETNVTAVIEVSSFSEVEGVLHSMQQSWGENVIVCLDIDDTVLTSPSELPTDEFVVDWINSLAQRGITCMFLTSRSRFSHQETLAALVGVGVEQPLIHYARVLASSGLMRIPDLDTDKGAYFKECIGLPEGHVLLFVDDDIANLRSMARAYGSRVRLVQYARDASP